MKALVVGATGLVGSELVRLLADGAGVEEVRRVARRPPKDESTRVRDFIVDFERLDDFSSAFAGVDVVFSALGTTLKTAGSKAAQRRVDFDYQLEAARLGRAGGARTLVLVSSMGADPRSLVFYSRMKGELEHAVQTLGYPSVVVLRPGILDGERREHRPGERFALGVLRLVPAFDSLAGLRPIPATTVARAALRAARDASSGLRVFEARDLFRLGAAEAL